MTDKQKSVVDLVADVLDELCGADFRGVKAICQRASYLEAELDKHRWRKVEDDGLPKDSRSLKNLHLVVASWNDEIHDDEPFMITAAFIDNKFIFQGCGIATITHWKPITPPEQEE